jgi:hypothetical protein
VRCVLQGDEAGVVATCAMRLLVAPRIAICRIDARHCRHHDCRMSAMSDSRGPLGRWTGVIWRAFVIGLAVWVAAAALLGVPHGEGHSIESMAPVQTVHDIAFPVWVGSLAALLGALTLTLLRRPH